MDKIKNKYLLLMLFFINVHSFILSGYQFLRISGVGKLQIKMYEEINILFTLLGANGETTK